MKHTVSEVRPKLIELLKHKQLIILAGAGVSYDSGLPLWDELIDEFIAFCVELQKVLADDDKFPELLDDVVKEENRRYPARIASVLKDRLEQIDKKNGQIKGFFDDWLTEILNGRDASLKAKRATFPTDPGIANDYHHAIVKTDYPFILTSNYDKLLESAAKQNFGLTIPSFTYKTPGSIATAIYERKPAIVHIHGVLNDVNIGDFVFTEQDYSKIKRLHPGFRLSLESLFIRYSTLFVGYGGSDPHLEDISEGLSVHLWQESQKEYGFTSGLPNSYLVLHKDRVGEVTEKYKEKLRTEIIVINDFNESLELLQTLQKECPRLS